MNNKSVKSLSFRVVTIGFFVALVVFVLLTLMHRTAPVTGYPVTVRWVVYLDSVLMQADSVVMPVVYRGNPDFSQVKGSERKQRFIHLMLPSILMAQEKVKQERTRLEDIHLRIEDGLGTRTDSTEIKAVLKRYRCRSMEQLLENIHPHPVSIVLAQAAIETGWGTSRFFKEAKNVYGMWSYNSSEQRIKAFEGREGRAIYLRKYDNLHDSVYDYFYTVSRANAYKEFRKARRETQDPFVLIKHLLNYSEMREEYVEILRKVIQQNELTKFDNYQLAKINEDDPIWKSL